MTFNLSVVKDVLNWSDTLKPVVNMALKKGKEGAAYLQAVLKTKGLNAKIIKNNLVMDGYFKEIGKCVYEKKIRINNVDIKDNIERIENCKKANEKINKEIKAINQEIKDNDLFKDMPDVSKLVSNIQKMTDDSKTQIMNFINKNTKSSKKSNVAKKSKKSKKNK